MRTAAALLAIVLLLAGCVASEREPAAPEPEPGLAAVEALGGAATDTQDRSRAAFEVTTHEAAGDAAAWYLATVDVTPGAPASLAGFRWRVPPGSVHGVEGTSGLDGVSLEVAFLVPDGASVDSFAVHLFAMDGDTPEFLGAWLGLPYDVTLEELPGEPVETDIPASLQPGLWFIPQRYAASGTELGLVVAAEGNTSAFGVAWRVLDHNFVGTAEVASAAGAVFLDRVRPLGPALLLAPVGRGEGAQAALYLDFNTGFTVGFESRSGPVTVEDRLPTGALRPTATVRDVTLASSFEGAGAGGWGMAFGLYVTVAGAAPWSVVGDVHGEPVARDGVAAAVLNGYAAFYQVLGGEGPASDVAFAASIASADWYEVVYFLTLDLGTPVSTLLASAPPATHNADGMGAATRAGSDVLLEVPGGIGIRLAGVVPR